MKAWSVRIALGLGCAIRNLDRLTGQKEERKKGRPSFIASAKCSKNQQYFYEVSSESFLSSSNAHFPSGTMCPSSLPLGAADFIANPI